MAHTPNKQEKELEAILGIHGKIITMTASDKIPEIENRYNLHMGQVYRLMISGTNPLDYMTFDGIMVELTAFIDKEGFSLSKVVLENGLECTTYSGKKPFDRFEFRLGDTHLLGFGRIIDEEGFYRARDRDRLGD